MSSGPGIHPRDAWRPTESHAEQAVWRALRTGMPPGWYGWHSLRVRDPHGYVGEGDFVLASPERGLLVLEVKGGQVEQRDGRWFQNGRPMDEPPLEQGTGYARKLVRRLGDLDCTPPAYGVGVCFPDTAFTAQPSQDDLNGIVVGSAELPYLGDALPAVMERALPAVRPGHGRWIEALHRLWGDTWVPSLGLGMRAQEAQERRLRLDPAQLDVLDGILENDRVLVQGGAGSGKTLVAVEAARRLAADGRKVLLLCFTAPLQKWLASRLAGSGVDPMTVSGLAKGIVDGAGIGPVGPIAEGPEAWAAVYLAAADNCERRWDAVIVDEAQDLQDEAWMLVSCLAEGRRLIAFHDPGQAFWAERRPPAELFQSRQRLPRQVRNPPGVNALSNRILGLPFDAAVLAAAHADGTIGLVTAPSSTSVPEKVGAEVDRLLSAGLAPGQIGIVSLRGQTAEDAIHRLPRIGRHAFVRAHDPAMESSLVADTFLRWKGLERPAIVVTDLPEGMVRQLPVRLNVAVTRAMVTVRFVGTAGALAPVGPA
ncbi:MAG TPA: AAA family ATPase [Thermoanaerobaculia bacterium]|nr:AAA family ATPase [Thermoanaerobaculia bacterium]